MLPTSTSTSTNRTRHSTFSTSSPTHPPLITTEEWVSIDSPPPASAASAAVASSSSSSTLLMKKNGIDKQDVNGLSKTSTTVNNMTNATTAPTAAGGSGGYAWEEEYKRSWDVLEEDENGLINTSIHQLNHQLKRRRRLRDPRTLQRGLIRYMILALDTSEAMLEKDYAPTRAGFLFSFLPDFILEFFDQNPLSQLALIATCKAQAFLITEFSGNPHVHIQALQSLYASSFTSNPTTTTSSSVDVTTTTITTTSTVFETKHEGTQPTGGGVGGVGAPSMLNVIQLSQGLLHSIPSHTTKEVVFIQAALTSWDPSTFTSLLPLCQRDRIRISVVSLTAELHLCKLLCNETQGAFGVALNEVHFKELLYEHLSPPPIFVQSLSSSPGNLMHLGFPERLTSPIPFLCACHATLHTEGFECPRCSSRVCTVPTDCNTCGLSLVLASHLARSYHHLFPVPTFTELTQWESSYPTLCGACLIPFPIPPSHEETLLSVTKSFFLGRYQCPQCHQHFCIDCDVFIHEVLHNCPTCIHPTYVIPTLSSNKS